MSDTSDGVRSWMGASLEDTGRRRPPYTSTSSEASMPRPAHQPRPRSAAGTSRLGRMGQSAGAPPLTASSSATSSASGSGAVDEEDFQRAFAETPEEPVSGGRGSMRLGTAWSVPREWTGL